MFGVLTLERDPLRLADILSGVVSWVQVAGSLAAVCLLCWLPVAFFRGGWSAPGRRWTGTVFNSLLAGAGLGYCVFLVLRIPDILAALSSEEGGGPPEPSGRLLAAAWTLFAAGGCALLAACLPFFVGLLDLRWRRIWAIARLSFKEAVRRRVLYVICGLIFFFLFLNWFVQTKPETQLQSYVEIVFDIMTPLLLVSAALVSAFSIPTDIRQQTIHTVVTKPVQRFEIVLGRVLGYTLLMTLLVFLMAGLSLFFVLRGVNPEAAAESLKARVPVYGTLLFQRVEREYTEREEAYRTTPENVGREWDYRRYIAGQDENKPSEAVMYAVWSFHDLPANLDDRDVVRCEFNFDIYRVSKGIENQGILCSFFFQTRNYQKTHANRAKYYESRRTSEAGIELTPNIDNELSEEFGYFEVQGKSVADFHTLSIDIPAGLIRNARRAGESPDDAPLQVRVRCGSPGQMVGMARYDLYIRADDPEGGADTLAFAGNYFKGTVGLWMRLVLIIALCVSVSTELGGIITFLCVILLYMGGVNRDFIGDLVRKENVGGGPFESAHRLLTRQTISAPLEETTMTKVATASDELFRWLAKFLLDVLPDVDRYTYTEQVANGFNIAVFNQDLLPSLLMLLGYLFPWAILSFYLIRGREIAGAN